MVGVAKVDEAEEKWAFADQPVVEFVTSTDVPPQIRIYPLQYVKVNVAGVECNKCKKSCCFITMCKAHSKVTHIKQQKYFHHLKRPGYNTDFLL